MPSFSVLLPDFIVSYIAELGASLSMAALGWIGREWQSDPETAALQHAYATGIAAMLMTFPVHNNEEEDLYRSMLEDYFERELVRIELMKFVQPNQTPSVETLVLELKEAIYTPTVVDFQPETAIQALLQGFEIGAYDSEEYRSRLTLKQLSYIGAQSTQQTHLLETMSGSLRCLSQQLMGITFVPTAPSENRVVAKRIGGENISRNLRVRLIHLKEQIQSGRVALFVGAGVSREAGLPGGWELAEMLAAEIDYVPQPGDSLGTIAEYYQRATSRTDLIGKLNQWLDEGAKPGPSHELIPQFNWQTVYTTNYDQLLEQSFKDAGQPFRKVLYNQQLHGLSTSVTPIIKLHGCLSWEYQLSQEAPIVVTDQDYEDYNHKQKTRQALISELQQHLRRGNTLLFLGYSLRDAFWQELRQDVTAILGEHAPSYYAVMPHFTDQWAKYCEVRQIHLVASTAHTFLKQLIAL